MISPDIKSDCMDARLYYHDFLSDQTKSNIPKEMLEHITRCRHCQKQISRLESILAHANGKSEQNWQNTAITTILRLHLAYINKSVSCSIAKPFLPSLIIPDLKISIPTPITVHLDNCPACTDNLLKIRDFELNRRQLFRFGRFLAEKSSNATIDCSNAQLALQSAVSMEFDKTNAEILRHLCTCPDCRKSLYEHREELRKELQNNHISQDKFPCQQVSTTDMFSYCIPYGIDPANDEYAEFRESLTSHLSSCPTCLGKMQQLHTDIYDIAERKDSGIITCFTFQEQGDEAMEIESNEKCVDWPINVKVINQKELTETVYSDDMDASSIKHKQKTGTLKLKQFLKPTLAAAAMILIACTLFFSTPSAKAVSLAQIYEAVEKITNVCISSFQVGRQEPYQKTWISTLKRVRLVETKKHTVLWNLQNWTKKEIDKSINLLSETSIQPDVRKKYEDSLSGSFGLIPFSDIRAVEKDAEWNRVDDKSVTSTVSDAEVYELTWSKQIDNYITEYYKWRVFVNIQTNLPMKTEWYQKTNADSEYALQITDVITYPTDNEIEAAIQNAFH